MSLINFVASKLNHVDEFKLIYFFLPLLYLEYKKNNKEVSLAFFKIFLSFNLSVLVKGVLRIPHPVYTHTLAFPSGHCWIVPVTVYALLLCLIKEKKTCILWTLFAGFMEIFICVYNAHHTLFDCFGGLILGLASLFLIELYLKHFNYKKLIFADVLSIISVLIVNQLSPVYLKNSMIGILLWFFVSHILYIYPSLKNKVLKK